MKNKNQNVWRTAIAIIGVAAFVLEFSSLLWKQFAGAWIGLLMLLVFILRVVLIVMLVLMAVRVAKYAAWRRPGNYSVAGIAVAYLLMVWIMTGPPVFLEISTSPPYIIACREDMKSTSRITFRNNGTFQRKDHGIFRYSNHRGTYTQKGDTLFLHFTKGEPGLLGDTLVVRAGAVYRVQADTTVHTYYHVGACPGLN